MVAGDYHVFGHKDKHCKSLLAKIHPDKVPEWMSLGTYFTQRLLHHGETIVNELDEDVDEAQRQNLAVIKQAHGALLTYKACGPYFVRTQE